MVTLEVGKVALRKMIKKDPTKSFISEEDEAFSFSLQAQTTCLEKTRFLKCLGYVQNSDEFVKTTH